MTWEDRIREAAYEAPSGARFSFAYENVSEVFEKKTSAFEFPDARGTYVQDLGPTGRRYPLRVFFWGPDYDQEAEAFGAGLREIGPGRLHHPAYGVLDVVPFGKITRRDDLKTQANQAVFDVTFWETIGVVYPSAQQDPAADVAAAVEEYNEASADSFADSVSHDTAIERATLESDSAAALNTAVTGLQSTADAQPEVSRQFGAIADSISRSLGLLVSEPLTLALQTLQLLQTPALAPTDLITRVTTYRDLLAQTLAAARPTEANGTGARAANRFQIHDLYASTYLTGAVVAVVNGTFTTRTEALTAAEEILADLETLVSWRDQNFVALGLIDTGEAYQKLRDAVVLAAGFLVTVSFSLKQERRVVLDRARTCLDLAAELYGNVDTQLDFLINSNRLTGSEILELPKGKEIVYYL